MFRFLNKCDLCKIELAKQIPAIKCCLICVRGKSYYHALGLNSTASTQEIKSAYYKLSLQYHPDKNSGNPDSVAKFREITEAYEVLGNPEKKRVYDQRGEFQPYYSRGRSYTGSYYKPKNYEGPFTGKTQDFDYDEHFRKHYQEFEKQRQAEHEYFKRRWEAEFYRRYPNPEDYYRRRHEHREAENREGYEELSRRFAARKRPFIFLFSLWALLLIIQGYREFYDPDMPRMRGPVYYKVKKENDKVQND